MSFLAICVLRRGSPSFGFQFHFSLLNKKILEDRVRLCFKDELLRGATLIHGSPCALRDTDIPPAANACPALRYTGQSLSLAPSAVHLPYSFQPGSQLPGLSVWSFTTLSPHQRFVCIEYSTPCGICQGLCKNFQKKAPVRALFDIYPINGGCFTAIEHAARHRFWEKDRRGGYPARSYSRRHPRNGADKRHGHRPPVRRR